MAATLVQHLPVTTEASITAPDVYPLHSWRPWMSLYGLRLKPQGSAQRQVPLRTRFGLSCPVLLWLQPCAEV